MSDAKQERNERIKAMVRTKYDEIGGIIMPTQEWLDANPDVNKGEAILAGQAALGLAVCGNIDALSKSEVLLKVDGDKLLIRADALHRDIHEAFHRAYEAKPKFKTEGNVVHFPQHKTVQ